MHRDTSSQPASRGLSDSLARMDWGRAFQRELQMEVDDGFGGYSAPLLDAVRLFDELGIGYALVGGVAAMQYGRRRITEDVDLVAAAGHERILAEHHERMKAHRFDPGCTRKLYHEAGIEIDLWKDEHADAIVERARTVTLAGRPVRITDPHDLIAMKLRADRPQDDYDISEIVRHTPIDDATVRSRVAPERFEHYLSIKRRIGMK